MTTSTSRLFHLMTFSLAAVLYAQQPAAADEECEQALAALKTAGAFIRYEDGETETDREEPCKDIETVLFSAGYDEAKAVASLPHLLKLPDPKLITLEFRGFEMKYAEALAEQKEVLNNLKAVELGMEESVTDAQLCQLSQISTLEVLAASSPERIEITDDGLACLKDLSNIKVLNFNNTRITDAGLAHLSQMEDVSFLSFMTADISGEGFRHLKGTALKRLYLADTKVDDEGLRFLKHFEKLERLLVSECPIEGPGLIHLASLKNLRLLVLSGTKVDDKALAHLRAIPQLEDLSLYGCNITDSGIDDLSALTGLKILGLGDTKMTPEGIAKLREALPDTKIEYW